jgi:hypothetical protein
MKNDGAAFYARQGSSRADFWTLLHPPYTAWNISYVVVGSTLAPTVNWLVLTIILASFFCGTGIAAHALDELNGHPLKTGFSDKSLKLMSTVSLFVAFILSTLASLLTTPRFVRRKTSSGSALFHTADNHDIKWDRQKILSTWEKPLRLLSWSVILLAISLLVTK